MIPSFRMRSSLVVAAALSLSVVAVAQERTSSVGLGYSDNNLWQSGSAWFFESGYDPSGGTVSVSGSMDFDGPDRDGNMRTTTLSGSAWATADYGILRTSADASVLNTFFNEENPDNEIPNIYIAYGQANFTDTLRYEAQGINQNWRVRYVYYVHGMNSGVGYGALGVDIGANYESFFFGDPGLVAGTYATELYELDGNLEHEIRANLYSGIEVHTDFLDDGSDVFGSSQFGQTVVLQSIELYDEANNLVTDFSIESASGSTYPVPEPMTMSLLGLGLAGLAARRRRKA